MAALLQVDNVVKRFGGVTAVDDVSLSVDEAEMVGLIGANGAGKTTLFSMISGHVPPSEGSIRFDGRRINGLPVHQVCRRRIARTYQIVRPFRNLTVLENVLVGAMFGSRRESSDPKAKREAMSLLEELGLAERAHSLASELTLAGHKRLEVARALATEPRLLLLDEVFAGLTPSEVDDAMNLVQGIAKERALSVILVEHVLKVVMRLCPRIIVLHHGVKIAEGDPQAISTDAKVIEAYLGDRS